MKRDELIKPIINLLNETGYKELPYESIIVDKYLQIKDPEKLYIEKEEYKTLHKIIDNLSELEKKLIYLLYFDSKTYTKDELTKKLRITKIRLYYLKQEVLEKLKTKLK